MFQQIPMFFGTHVNQHTCMRRLLTLVWADWLQIWSSASQQTVGNKHSGTLKYFHLNPYYSCSTSPFFPTPTWQNKLQYCKFHSAALPDETLTKLDSSITDWLQLPCYSLCKSSSCLTFSWDEWCEVTMASQRMELQSPWKRFSPYSKVKFWTVDTPSDNYSIVHRSYTLCHQSSQQKQKMKFFPAPEFPESNSDQKNLFSSLCDLKNACFLSDKGRAMVI